MAFLRRSPYYNLIDIENDIFKIKKNYSYGIYTYYCLKDNTCINSYISQVKEISSRNKEELIHQDKAIRELTNKIIINQDEYIKIFKQMLQSWNFDPYEFWDYRSYFLYYATFRDKHSSMHIKF